MVMGRIALALGDPIGPAEDVSGSISVMHWFRPLQEKISSGII